VPPRWTWSQPEGAAAARVQTLPTDVKVTAAVRSVGVCEGGGQRVISEALIAAGLTAAMVLLFLGNWRSTVIIALTIPLSILASILVSMHWAKR